jgi:hypothetical protein
MWFATSEDPYTKGDYNKTLQARRDKFVNTHFRAELARLNSHLHEDANAMKPCNRTITVETPEHYSIEYVEGVLQGYFSYLEYNVYLEPRKSRSEGSTDRKITLTIS